MEPNDLLILNVTRTGSCWNRAAAYWAGQCDDQLCPLCKEKEGYDHNWTCKALGPRGYKQMPF